jgi:periplasmic protein TonB
MMRSASFFILSVSLHAAALVYPVSFGDRSRARLIQVTILPLEQDGGGGIEDQGRGGHHPVQVRSRSESRTTRNVRREVEEKPTNDPHPQTLFAEPAGTASDGSAASVSAPVNSSLASDTAVSDATSQSGSGSGVGMVDSSGKAVGASSVGSGRGNGNGSGAGSAGGGISLTQARYRDTPRPDYPESARREGREGSVLLRVLVDHKGRSKLVEINSSSGSEALDRAAADTIKRWRFYPAHFGDRPIESWLRIPIEFRLADAKSR